jgi:hypothetical protein
MLIMRDGISEGDIAKIVHSYTGRHDDAILRHFSENRIYPPNGHFGFSGEVWAPMHEEA